MFQVDFWSEVKRQKCFFSHWNLSAKSAFLSSTADNHEQLIIMPTNNLIDGHGLSISRKAETKEIDRNEWERNVLCCFVFFSARNCCLFTFSSPEKEVVLSG